MAATHEWKIQCGTSPGTEYPTTGSAGNCNYMSTDAYDSTGTDYQSNPIPVPESGTSYSYERWVRAKFSGTFNKIDNMKIWHDAGSLSDTHLDLCAGVGATYATPVNTDSSVATTTLTGWDSEAEALDITPTDGLTSPGYSKYLVQQLDVPSTVTTPGDIGSQTIKMKYDEQ